MLYLYTVLKLYEDLDIMKVENINKHVKGKFIHH